MGEYEKDIGTSHNVCFFKFNLQTKIDTVWRIQLCVLQCYRCYYYNAIVLYSSTQYVFMLLCPPSFSSRKLGFIDKSIKLLSLLQTIHLESKYERKSKMRQWILNKIISFFLDCLFDTDLCFFLIIFYGPALRCGIQFLGNLAVGNQMCKDDIWQQSFPNLLL